MNPISLKVLTSFVIINFNIEYPSELKQISEANIAACCEDINNAARKDHLECLQHHHFSGQTFNEFTGMNAAQSGSFKILNFLIRIHYSFDRTTILGAIKSGNLKTVKFCMDQGFPFDDTANNMAAYCGAIEILKYLRPLIPWNPIMLMEAAGRPDSTTLTYLHENNCPRDQHVYDKAFKNKMWDNVRFLLRNGYSPF